MIPLTDDFWGETEHLIPQATVDRVRDCAPHGDRDATLQQDALDALKASGYLKLAVPAQLEGLGANMLECCAVQQRLGAADPAVAIGLNMHLFSVGVLHEHWKIHQDRSWVLLEAIATQDRIVASAFAEPGLNGSLLRSNCRGTKVPGGFLVSGTKTPCSLLRRADLVCLQFQGGDAGREQVHVGLVHATAAGLTIDKTWDAMGMRCSESDTLVLQECFIPDDLIFHTSAPGYDDDPVFVAGLNWFALTASAVYVGLMKRVLRETAAILKQSRISYLDETRSSVPAYQSAFGKLVISALNFESACIHAARCADGRRLAQAALFPIALSIKDSAVDVCTRVVSEALELCGGRTYGAKDNLSRLWRDVQAIRFHPPTRITTENLIGRWALDVPFAFDLKDPVRTGPGPG